MTTTDTPAPPRAIPTSATSQSTLSFDRHSELLRAGAFAELRVAGFDHCPDCYTVRIDGVCRSCRSQAIFNADPDYRAWSDAQARLDHGAWAPDSDRPYTYSDVKADEAFAARLEAKFARAERDAATPPNACGKCGEPEGKHLRSRFSGICRYVPPSDAQRLARMYARRAARLGLPVWSRPGRVRTCEVCGEPSDARECGACVIDADITYTRSVDQ